jgi:hypothetical protein
LNIERGMPCEEMAPDPTRILRSALLVLAAVIEQAAQEPFSLSRSAEGLHGVSAKMNLLRRAMLLRRAGGRVVLTLFHYRVPDVISSEKL